MHVRRERPQKAVAKQNAQEGSHQRGAYLVANLGRRSADGAHGDHDAQHGRDDPQARQGIRDLLQRMHRLIGFMVVDVHVALHYRIELEMTHASRDRRAQRIANKVQRVMILDQRRILRKQRALSRIVDIGFQLVHAILAGISEDFVQHLERIQIKFLAVGAALQHSDEAVDDRNHRRDRVGDQQGAQGRAADDHQFGRLHQHFQVAMLHQVTANHGSDNNDDSDNGEHVEPVASSVDNGVTWGVAVLEVLIGWGYGNLTGCSIWVANGVTVNAPNLLRRRGNL